MDGINKKYNLGIEILTPLSVGAGLEKDWIKGIDYVIQNKVVYHLNLSMMMKKGIDMDGISLAFATENYDRVVQLLGKKIADVSDMKFDCPADSDNNIKVMVHNELSNNPILPGSSIKGAMRSILYNYLGASNSKKGEEELGSAKEGDDLMRFIKFSDAEFVGSKLVNTKIFNLFTDTSGHWTGGWKHGRNTTIDAFRNTGFNTLYECLAPGQKSYCSLMLSPSRFLAFAHEVQPHSKQQEKNRALEIKSLFQIINNYTRTYLLKEKAFFLKYDDAEKTDLIIDAIDNLLAQIPSDGSCAIMKMAAGVGFHSLSGDWRFENYADGLMGRKEHKEANALPKSRKIAVLGNEGLTLMGFIRLSNLEDTADIDERIKQSRDKANEAHVQIVEEKNKPSSDLGAELNGRDKANEERINEERDRKEKEADEAARKADEALKQKDPIEDDIVYTRWTTFKQVSLRCKVHKEVIDTPHGQNVLHQWLRDFFQNLPTRDKKQYKNPKKWKETFGGIIDDDTIQGWIEEFTK